MKKKIIGIGSIVVLLIIGCVFYFTREEKITLSLKDKESFWRKKRKKSKKKQKLQVI